MFGVFFFFFFVFLRALTPLRQYTTVEQERAALEASLGMLEAELQQERMLRAQQRARLLQWKELLASKIADLDDLQETLVDG